MVRALLAPGRIVHAAHRRGEPHAALVVEHRVVLVRLGVPQHRVAPIGRRRRRRDRAGMARSKRDRHVRIGHRHLEGRDLVGLRIEDRHQVGRVFGRAVKRAAGIDRRLAPVGRDQVVQILVRRRPVPGGDDDVALDAGRPLRLVLGQFALRDAVGPVAEILVRHAAELAGEAVGHHLAGLAGGDAADPGVGAGIELAELRRNRAGRFLAELMAADAVDIVHALQPGVARDVLRNVGVAAEVRRGRDLHHRVPVDRRIIMRGRAFVGRLHGGVVEDVAGLDAHLRRVDEAVAAHPDLIVGDRQIGDDVAALIVGDDAAGEAGRQIGRLGDHPDAGFRPARAGDDAADVVGIDGDGGARCRLRAQRCRRRHQGERDCRDAEIQCSLRHVRCDVPLAGL